MKKNNVEKADAALIGLAVMGENLALNMVNHGYRIAVANRSAERTGEFAAGRGKGKNFIFCHNYSELVNALRRPRKIFLMIKAGDPVDALLKELLPLLEPGDVVADCGNSNFADTERRIAALAKHGVLFAGCGVSGGESGALHGPSIMPGGAPEAMPEILPLLQSIAAKAPDGTPCCAWVGPGGSGHFVKTVHNGIEYGDMQLISEAYWLLSTALRLDDAACGRIFRAWNATELESYLLEITSDILDTTDPASGKPILSIIRDSARQKGTGKWSGISAMELDVAVPVITEAVFARFLSAAPEARQAGAQIFPDSGAMSADLTPENIRQALYAAKICAYAQGFQLIRAGSERYNWGIDCARTAALWRGGCIIKAAMLNDISNAFSTTELPDGNLIFADSFSRSLRRYDNSWRQCVVCGLTRRLPMPAFSAALSWFDAVRSSRLPTVLIQAQRDYFGAHTYERTDSKPGESYHTDWLGDKVSHKTR